MDRMFLKSTVEVRIDGFEELARVKGRPSSYRMRLFPQREMASDMVRYTQTPFCGMRPFVKLVDNVARDENCTLGGACSFTFVEGGAHIGDCTLWAASALEVSGVSSFAVGYEALPDASDLFHQSVIVNRMDGRVVVVPKALTSRAEGTVSMVYYPARNGEATLARVHSQCGEGCVQWPGVPRVTLDLSWPALRPGVLDVLKLSVNGEELNTMRGARSLLAKRQVCLVMMHVTKVQRGWQDPQDGAPPRFQYSSELWGILQDGGMDVALHLDEDVTGQVHDDPRPRPATHRLKSAEELDAIFDGPAFPHDYVVARQRAQPASPCEGSAALRNYGKVFMA